MKFALVDNQRIEAKKGLKGFCPICQQPVIAKCGKYKINHWAHKSLDTCDKWWENETEWHRQWKDIFPIEWQEIIAIDDKTGEKHIADIKTNYNMVVEFQHSNISEEERISREKYYNKSMFWIVDGTRRKRDFVNFANAFKEKHIWRIGQDNPFYVLHFGNSYLPKEWQNSIVPVFFDFKGLLDKNEGYDYNRLREPLWCLLPIIGNNINVLFEIDRRKLVKMIQNGGIIFDYNAIVKDVNKAIQNRRLYRF